MSYSRVGYNLEITNKTDKTIVIADNKASKEITLNINGYLQNANNVKILNAVLLPGETKEFQIIFDKYYDSKKDDEEINLNYIRVLQDYSEEITLEEQNARAIKIYSFNIGLK